MVAEHFKDVETWVFDLDNTLYPPHIRLFDQIERKMTDYVMRSLRVGEAEADHLRREYWAQYGTTLAGLMGEHGIAPDPYLADVHDIDLSAIPPDPELRNRIRTLPGRKIVYTNGASDYAERVLEARGLGNVFDAVYGVEHAAFRPKPERAAFDKIFELDGLSPGKAAMFEDDARNLKVPHQLGMRTVHVAPERLEAPHVHHHTRDLGSFLAKVI